MSSNNPEKLNIYLCFEAHVVEINLKTNFLQNKWVTAYLDTKVTKKMFFLDFSGHTESHICSIKPVECTALKSDERRHASTKTQKTLG